jgi:hypothetical protein
MGGGAQARAYLRGLSQSHHPKGHEPMTEIADAARNRWTDGAHNANMMRGS